MPHLEDADSCTGLANLLTKEYFPSVLIRSEL